MTRIAQLSAFADQDSDNAVLLCDLLDELLAHGDIDAVERRLVRVPAALSDLPAVRFRAARAKLQSRDFLAAARLLEALWADMNPPPAGIVHDLVHAQMLSGQADQALKTLDTYSPDGTDAELFVLLRARALHHLRRHLDAVEVLAAIHRGPHMAQAKGLEAMLWLDEGDDERALAAADIALALDDEQQEAAIVKGTLALRKQHLDESTAHFQRVLTRHPDAGRALLGLGQGSMLRGDIPVARAWIDRAAVRMPNHLGTWHALAWCQLIEGDLAGARKSFDTALAVDRTFGETHGGIALVHALRGERMEAEMAIKRALRLDPRSRSARYAHSVLLLDDGRAEDAQREMATLLTSSSPTVPNVPADFIFRLRELVRPRG